MALKVESPTSYQQLLPPFKNYNVIKVEENIYF